MYSRTAAPVAGGRGARNSRAMGTSTRRTYARDAQAPARYRRRHEGSGTDAVMISVLLSVVPDRTGGHGPYGRTVDVPPISSRSLSPVQVARSCRRPAIATSGPRSRASPATVTYQSQLNLV